MAKTDWEYGDIVKHTDMNDIGEEINANTAALSADDPVPVSLVPGVQIVDSPRVSHVRNVGMSGRTLVNLLGRDGNCESLAPFTLAGTPAPTLSTSQKRSGTSCFRVTAPSPSGSYLYKDYSYKLDVAKRYIILAWVYIESGTGGLPEIGLRDVGTFTTRIRAYADESKVGQWQLLKIKVPTANTLVGNGFRLFIGCSAPGSTIAYFDEIRLYELSAADYDAIGTTYTTDEEMDAFLPYVDDMKHVEAVRITNPGKNLLPTDVSGWVQGSYNAFGAPVTSTFRIKPANGEISVVSNTSYTVSFNTPYEVYLHFHDSNNVWISGMGWNLGPSITFTTPANCKIVKVVFRIDDTTVMTPDMIFDINPMLNIGTEALPFEPQQPSHLYLWDMNLASNVDRSVRDEMHMDSEGKPRVTRRFREVVLDGSLAWSYLSDMSGFKNLVLSQSAIGNTIPNSTYLTVVKFDGKILSSMSGTGDSDQVYFGSGNLSITVADTDSGFGESYTPSADEVKAYFYGWRMYNNDAAYPNEYNGTGTKKWVKIGGSTGSSSSTSTTLPTTENDLDTWTPYRLNYQLAQSVDEAVSYEGELMLHDGPNQVEVGMGIVVREAANPSTTTSTANINVLTIPSSFLKWRTGKPFNVYRNDKIDSQWATPTDGANGIYRYRIAIEQFDPTAAYSVTYEALDKYLIGIAPLETTGEVVPNIKEAVDDLTRGLTEAKTLLSVLANTKAQKQPPLWITATLLNGWAHQSTNINNSDAGYFKNDCGEVTIRGTIKSGITTGGTVLFYLPQSYRPDKNIRTPVLGFDGTTTQACFITVNASDGSVTISAGSTAVNNLLSLDQITFRTKEG